jgi:transcription initiation factor TFIIIB Brf1 subunit/transcription initiation factor TFIIB
MQKELNIKDELIQIEQKKAEVYSEAFDKEKELTDRALKLADQAEKKSLWQSLGFVGIAIAAVVLAIVH